MNLWNERNVGTIAASRKTGKTRAKGGAEEAGRPDSGAKYTGWLCKVGLRHLETLQLRARVGDRKARRAGARPVLLEVR